MWTETAEGHRFVREITRSVVLQIAPEEMDLFDDLVDEYFLNPTQPPSEYTSTDDPLGFGLNEALIAVAPAAAAMVQTVLNHLFTETIKAAEEESTELVKVKIKKLFKQETQVKGVETTGEEEIPSLSKEQLEQIKKLARKRAMEFGVAPKDATKMANALIGSLVLAA